MADSDNWRRGQVLPPPPPPRKNTKPHHNNGAAKGAPAPVVVLKQSYAVSDAPLAPWAAHAAAQQQRPLSERAFPTLGEAGEAPTATDADTAVQEAPSPPAMAADGGDNNAKIKSKRRTSNKKQEEPAAPAPPPPPGPVSMRRGWAHVSTPPAETTSPESLWPSLQPALAAKKPLEAGAPEWAPQSAFKEPSKEPLKEQQKQPLKIPKPPQPKQQQQALGFLKPKPQGNFLSFKLDVGPKKSQKEIKRALHQEQSSITPSKDLQESTSKQVVRDPKVPKKKRLTSLKKRILLERVERWYTAHPELRIIEEAVTESETVVVRIENMVRGEDIQDEDERLEILEDVRRLCESVDQVHPIGSVDVVVPADESDLSRFVPVDVRLGSLAEAERLVAALSERVVGGKHLQASTKREHDERRIVRIMDVLDEESDEDELEEVQSDVRKLASAHGEVLEVTLEGRCALVKYALPAQAAAALLALSSTKIGGEVLRCELVQDDQAILVLLNALDPDEPVDDEEELEEIKQDLKNLVLKALDDEDVTLEVSFENGVHVKMASTALARRAAAALRGVVISGRALETSVLSSSEEQEEEVVVAPPKEEEGETPLAPNVFSTKLGLVKMPLKYAQARKTPQIANSDGPRQYVGSQPLDSDLDGLATTLLGRLFELQERVRINEPLKAKMRRRLVFGLREVRRGIRAQNIKCVVVAPNIDEGTTLADQIDEVITAAREMEIPVVFALGKRKLGKALRKKVAVSAVGIYSGDGAHDEYRAMLLRLRQIKADPTVAVHPIDAHKLRQQQRQKQQQIAKTENQPDAAASADGPIKKPKRRKKPSPKTVVAPVAPVTPVAT